MVQGHRAARTRDDVILRPVEQGAFRDGRRREHALGHVVLGQHLERRPGLEHEDMSLFAGQVDLAVGGDGRRGEGRRAACESLLELDLAGLGVVHREHAVVLHDVDQPAVDERRAHVAAVARRAPGDAGVAGRALGKGDVARRRFADRVDGRLRSVRVGDEDQAVVRRPASAPGCRRRRSASRFPCRS